ncbi:MAG TPA: hypothetical protein VF832_19095, partial [Longimicrobiales bacterium]
MSTTEMATADPRALWAARVFPAGLALVVLGMVLVILGVRAPGILLPGVVVLDVALVLLAAGGILRAVT